MGFFMSYRTVLLSGAAVIAISSSAWAAQGDTYLSLFGGYSNLADADIHHGKSTTEYIKVEEFNARGTALTDLGIVPLRVYTSVKLTSGGTTTATVPVLKSVTRVGTAYGYYKVTDTQDFSGTIGSSGWVVGAAMGVELGGGLRGEAEFAFRRFDIDDGAVLNSAFLNRRRIRDDALYNYRFPITLGTYTGPYTDTQTAFVSSYRKADVTVTHSTTNLGARADGEFTSFSFMANLWYDFPLGDSGFTPFIGAGIGIANLTLSYDFRGNSAIPEYRFNNIGTIKTNTGTSNTNTITGTLTTTTTPRTFATSFKDDEAVLAYQFGAGLGYEFESGLRLAAQYRYFATTDADFGHLSESIKTSDVIFSISLPFGAN